jgi:hypothetical protein
MTSVLTPFTLVWLVYVGLEATSPGKWPATDKVRKLGERTEYLLAMVKGFSLYAKRTARYRHIPCGH